MATETKVNPADIAREIKSLRDDQTAMKSAVAELLKAAREPASRAGMTPQQFIAKASGGGPVAFGPDGLPRPVAFNPRGRRIGKVFDGAESRDFGEFLQSFYEFASRGPNAPQAAKALERFGVERVVEKQDGAITKAALAENSGITGGYTVPPVFANQLLTLAVEQEIVSPRASSQPLTSRTVTVPSLDVTTSYGAGSSPFLGGVVASWTAEAATRTESEPQFRNTTLTAHELSFYTVASNTLLADEAVGLDALLTQLFGAAIGWYKDYAFLQGNGVGKPLGVLNSPAAIKVSRAAGSHFRFSDVGQMLSKLPWANRKNDSIAWVVHQSVIPELFTMNDLAGSTAGTGRVLFIPMNEGVRAAIPEGAGPSSFGSLAGYPVLVSEKVPSLGNTGDVMLVDFSKYLLGDRQELQIDVSPHVKFLTNQMTWRVVWRGDGQPWLNGAITLADGTYTVSPFVVLQ